MHRLGRILFILFTPMIQPITLNDSVDLYDDNSGTTLCISFDDCLIFGSDTRHSTNSIINSRECSKIFIDKNFIFTGTGFYADIYEVYQRLRLQVRVYQQYNQCNTEDSDYMPIEAIAHLLFNILYSRRFFPFYSFSILGGYSRKDKKFKMFSYDPLGSYDEYKGRVYGSSSPMIQPLLDSLISKKNWSCSPPNFNREDTLKIIETVFNASAERDVKTGDYLEIVILDKEGVKKIKKDLRKD